MLVYQFMSRGSLNDHLHGPNAFKYPNLDWRTRLKITLDAAQGLEYLHWQMDEDVSQVFTAVRGTTRYLHPRYFTTHMLTKKSDVYSFGVVLLEIICGRRPIDTTLSEDKLTLI